MTKPYNWTDEHDVPVKGEIDATLGDVLDPDDPSTYKCHCGRAKPCRHHRVISPRRAYPHAK